MARLKRTQRKGAKKKVVRKAVTGPRRITTYARKKIIARVNGLVRKRTSPSKIVEIMNAEGFDASYERRRPHLQNQAVLLVRPASFKGAGEKVVIPVNQLRKRK